MNLNFWQWIGVLLLILGAVLMFRSPGGQKVQPPRAPATQQTR
jgi:drug/metabolite transporter (DMT)-like permease